MLHRYIKLQYITHSVLEGVGLGCGVIKDSPSQCHHHLTQEVVTAKHVAVPNRHPQCSCLQLAHGRAELCGKGGECIKNGKNERKEGN